MSDSQTVPPQTQTPPSGPPKAAWPYGCSGCSGCLFLVIAVFFLILAAVLRAPGGSASDVETETTPSASGEKRSVRRAGPVDLVIAFDTTSSMSGSIDSIRNKAIEVVSLLHRRSSSLRLGLVGFKDEEVDGEDAFELHPFTDDLDSQFAAMRDWEARGGGDTPEDQYKAILKAVEMPWRTRAGLATVARIIVVITDAPPKDPDADENTADTIAARVEAAGAHVYPIIVGNDETAQEHADKIAELTGGRAFNAEQSDDVAKVLQDAVSVAIAEHSPGTPGWVIGVLAVFGLLLLVFGVVLLGVGIFGWMRLSRARG